MSSYIWSKCWNNFFCNWVNLPQQPADFMLLTSTLLIRAPATTITKLWLLHFGLVCSLHGGVYARAKEHAHSQRCYILLIWLQQRFPKFLLHGLLFCKPAALLTSSLQMWCFSVPFLQISYFVSLDLVRLNYCCPTHFQSQSTQNKYEG